MLAISGGPDSMALLHYLWTHRDQWNISVEAVHINHQLRADEADADEAFVREECQEYGIPLTVQKVDVTKGIFPFLVVKDVNNDGLGGEKNV